MVDFIKDMLMEYGLNNNFSVLVSNIIGITLVVVIGYLIDIISKKIVLKIFKAYAERTKTKWDSILLEKKVFNTVFHLIPFAMLYNFAPVFTNIQVLLEKICYSAIIIITVFTVDKLLNAINEIYNGHEISKLRPIKGYLQVINIVLYIVAIIFIISVFLDKSPWFLLSGIGAATAVLMLIFQNSILGLVASIQISSNKMLQIGDNIEMPKYGADGTVTEITLHTVKIQNFDRTITTIPTHLLITDSFKNFRGMQESGSRRIKRSIFIDVNSITSWKISEVERILQADNISLHLSLDEVLKQSKECEGSLLTNIGVFRLYLQNYLNNNPKIIQEMIPVVRQLQPTERGLPIEIYAFTNVIVFQDYENLQSEIFDNILAIIHQFDLRIYQEPCGYDFRKLAHYNN